MSGDFGGYFSTGDSAGDSDRFDITFPTSPYLRDQVIPFTCAFSADRTEIRGTWSYRCKSCTCGGATGIFVLTRIADNERGTAATFA